MRLLDLEEGLEIGNYWLGILGFLIIDLYRFRNMGALFWRGRIRYWLGKYWACNWKDLKIYWSTDR